MSAANPTPSVPVPATRVHAPSGATAETLVLIALILQVVGGVIVLGGLAWFFGFSARHPFPYVWAAVLGATLVAGLVVVFLYFAYTLSYRRIQREEYQAAQAPTLVIGIFSLFLGLIPGIFYLIGYSKLSDAVREQQGWLTGPGGIAPGTLVACRGCGKVYPVGPFAFCPACGQKLGA